MNRLTRIQLCRIGTHDKLFLFGSDQVAAPTLKALHGHFSNLQVVTHHTKPTVKTVNQVEAYSRTHNIKLHIPIQAKGSKIQQWKQFASLLSSEQPTFGIVVSYGYMIPTFVINKFSKGMIVVHPSLLPKYRGGAPIFHAIKNGDTETGISYIDISPKTFDRGNILFQKRIGLPTDKHYDEIEQYIAQKAAQNIVQVTLNVEKLRPGQTQTEVGSSLAPIIKDNKLDLTIPAKEVYNMSRAMKAPRLSYDGIPMIVRLTDETVQGEGEPGKILRSGKQLYIRCGDRYIRLEWWKEPSKGQLPASAFIDKYLKPGRAIHVFK